MRNLRLTSLALLTLLTSGGAGAATVRWHPGETPPPTEIIPASPTQIHTVTFTAAVGFGTYGNDCEAQNWLGSPMISVNVAAREFTVEFTPRPFPPHYCLPYWLPVNGIEGELGQLDPGGWTLTITNINIGMHLTLPFTVISDPAASGELILHTFANDQATGTAFPFDLPFFIARPLGSRCNPAKGGGMSCGTATLQEGAPLTGITAVELASKTPVPPFTLPRSALKATITGSMPPYGPYQYVSTYAGGLANGTGSFAPGGGPGARTVTFPGNGGPGARVAIAPGVNQFGGTMRLLGAMGANRTHEYENKTFIGTGLSSFGVLGSKCTTTCYVTGAQSNFQYHQYKPAKGKATTANITTLGFPWTTGTVSITATAGPFPTLFRRNGYDNRTAMGLGTIQLVAPQLVRWDFPNRNEPWDRHTGAIGILRIKFVPEPLGWVGLIAGMALLVVFYRWQAWRSHLRRRAQA